MADAPWEVLRRYAPHDGTLAGLLASRAAADPERPFLLFGGRLFSYRSFAERVGRMAEELAARGVGRGERVAVIAHNSDAYVALFFALARLGAILVPVNPALEVEAMAFAVGHARAALVAAPAGQHDMAAAAARRTAASPPLIDLDAIGEDAGGQVHPPAGRADDVCVIVYTSGTTGWPKGVMHAQRSVVMAGEGFVERMHLVPEDRLLCVLPLHHINALFYSLFGALAAGASLALAERFSASDFWRLAARTSATEVNIIAAVGSILARRPRSELAAHALTKVYGAPILPEVAAVFRSDFGIATLIEGYGMTEVPGVSSVPFDGPHPPVSIGKPARHPDPDLHFAELRVVDDAGIDLPDGAVGELWVRTPIVMRGYYADPEATAAAFRDGWFMTGDLVRREPDGFYTFVARKKDIIRRRGENLSGAELDRLIAACPWVAEVATIAVPSDLGEDEVLAAVVPAPGAREADIVAHLESLPALKRPRYLALCDALPHTPTLRVSKHELRRDPTLIARALDLQRGGAGS